MDGIPGRVAFAIGLHAVRDLHAGRPRFLGRVIVRNPNPHVGIFFCRATKPRSDETARGSLDNRRGVAGRIGRFFVDELVGDQRGRSGNTRERGDDEESESGEEFHGVVD